MKLHHLSSHMMLNLTGRWLDDEVFVASLKSAGPLGLGILDQLQQAHEPLAELQTRRAQALASVDELTALISRLDARHDRKARSLHQHLDALAEGSDDAEEIEGFEQLQRRLFPTGLRVVKLPYVEEGGAAVALERSVDEELRAQLKATPVGGQTLADLLAAWLEAGHALGDAVRRRAELRASLTKDGSAVEEIDVRAGRKQWIQAVNGLLWAMEADAEIAVLDEPVRAALAQAIEVALRRKTNTGVEALDEVDEVDELDRPSQSAAAPEEVDAA